MKINPISNPNILKSYQASKAYTPQKSGVSNKRDEVSFSEDALSFSRAMSEARDKFEVRSQDELDRISEIKDAVRQGTYRVDSDKIADRILSSILGG